MFPSNKNSMFRSGETTKINEGKSMYFTKAFLAQISANVMFLATKTLLRYLNADQTSLFNKNEIFQRYSKGIYLTSRES